MSNYAIGNDSEARDPLQSYQPMSDDERWALIDPVFDAIGRNRRADTLEDCRLEMFNRLRAIEEKILAHFGAFSGGPRFITRAEAWTQACRQREFVREVCARMAEGRAGEPTALSEAIREIDIGEDVRVIPDYSKVPNNG